MWKRIISTAGVLVVVAAVFATGVWAGRTAFQVTEPFEAKPTEIPSVTVVEGDVGRSVNYGVVIHPHQRQIAVNRLTGTVTSRALDTAAMLTPGQELFRVDGLPVRAVPSEIPFYRNLESGITGPDVTAIQKTLHALEYLPHENQITGKYDSSTVNAVKSWQRDLGIYRSGIITAGEVLAVPDTETLVALSDIITVGSLISEATPVLFEQLPSEFLIRLSGFENSGLLPGQTVIIQYLDYTWTGVISQRFSQDLGADQFYVTTEDGSAVCGTDCAALPTQEDAFGQAQVVVTPEVSGASVPVAALQTTATGQAFVTLVSGQQVPVEILGSNLGVAVVSGVDVGQKVLLGATGSSQTQTEAAAESTESDE